MTDTTRRPNVLWILADQLRAQSLGHTGDPDAWTPNLDQLARMGQRFRCAVSGAPWCCPFRGALLTGRYPHQCGVDRTPKALDPAHPTIVDAMRSAGYHTAWIGKWHLAGSNHAIVTPPEMRGRFDWWVGYENNNNQHHCHVHGSIGDEPRRLPGYETDALTDLLLEHLEDHVRGGAYQPFHATLSVQPPHEPCIGPTNPTFVPQTPGPAGLHLRANVPPVPWVVDRARDQGAGYAAQIQNLDWNVGRILQALIRLGLDDNTWIVFFSDHGDMLGSHAQFGKSAPWEESIRVPFIVARVGAHSAMRCGNNDAVLNHVDIAPTTLGLLGIDVPRHMVGWNYASRCRKDLPTADPATEPDSAFLQQIPAKGHRHSVDVPWRGVAMRDGWKYITTPRGPWLLHNLHSDPLEQANLVHDVAFRDQRDRLQARLGRWLAETGDDPVFAS